MTRFYCVVFVCVAGMAGAQFQGFEAPVFKGHSFGFKPAAPIKDFKVTATSTATSKDKVQVELEETKVQLRQLQDRFQQQEKQASSIMEEMQGELNDTRGRMQKLEDRLKQQLSTNGNLQNVVKESEETLKVLQRNIKKQCLLMDQLQYSRGQAQSGTPTFMSATSSSTNNGGVAALAIDGNTDATYSRGSCTHTSIRDPSPWWQGRLRVKSEIHNITLTNRKDCCASRLKNVKIEGFEEDPINNPDADPHLCKMHSGQVRGTETITCDRPIVARFMKISLGNKGALTLCEVTLGGVEILRKGLAVQSSMTSFSTNANMANDDDVTTCSVTGSEAGDSPWWQMDLNGAVAVASVEITNRNDDKYMWLSNIRVDLYDELPSSCPDDTGIIIPKPCTSREKPVGQGEAVTLTCDVPQTGRYLRITKNVKSPGDDLSLCEVIVNVLHSQ
ncbi:uncharacterized protein [Haliotis asinina]|uniref:uncharacterized protein n=1 Tax=Haliotis asinina TaxID=109174 RepID=UPI00353263DC